MKYKLITIECFITATVLFTIPVFALAATASSTVPVSPSALLALSPANYSTTTNNIFTVSILLDTNGNTAQGVDIFYLNYNPSLLEVEDDDPATAGVQIGQGSLMPNTLLNSVNTGTGKISFSQVTNNGTSYTGSGVLASVRFKALAQGAAQVTFDFTPGSTIDTNIGSGGVDILTSVVNGSYTITQPPPDIAAPSAPAGLTAVAASTTQISLSWATSTDNVGVAGYRIFRCVGNSCAPSVQVATSTQTSYADTGLVAATSYSYAVRAYDVAGNVSSASAIVSVATQPILVKGLYFTLALEGKTSVLGKGFTIAVYLPNTASVLTQFTGQADNLNKVYFSPTSSLPIGSYDIMVSSPNYLRKKVSNLTFSENTVITLPMLFAGDLNNDNMINSIDWSLMYPQWLTNNALTDLNGDGLVNTIDSSLLNKNWLMKGD